MLLGSAVRSRESTAGLAPVLVDDPGLGDSSGDATKIDIRPTWNATRPSYSTAHTLTDPIRINDAATQAPERSDQDVQTDSQASTSGRDAADPAHLSSFLGRVAPSMLSALSAAANSGTRGVARRQHTRYPAPQLYHSLTAFAPAHRTRSAGSSAAAPSAGAQLVVTALSWSSQGATLAVAYGRQDIHGWCYDRGALATWNLARASLEPSKADRLIPTDSCLTACCFHPEAVALLAGGSYTGDLHVWDLSREGHPQVFASDGLAQPRHREPIVGLAWQRSLESAGRWGGAGRGHRLVSLGADGRVLVWLWHQGSAPVYGYELTWHQPGSDRRVLCGGTALSFQHSPGQEATTFVVSSEGGRLLRCLLDFTEAAGKDFARAAAAAAAASAGGSSGPDLRNPIRQADYEAHAGPANGVHFSPFCPDAFLSCGADGTVRLFHALRQQPLLVLQPCSSALFAVRWSSSRPFVFATAAADGCVYVYDLLAAQRLLAPVMLLAVNSQGEEGSAAAAGGDDRVRQAAAGHSKQAALQQPVHVLAFCGADGSLLAASAGRAAQVWRLPAELSDPAAGEAVMFREVMAADDVAQALRDML